MLNFTISAELLYIGIMTATFILFLIVFAVSIFRHKEITGYFVELLGVIFAAELGERYMDSKLSISGKSLDILKGKLSENDESKKTPKADEDVDF